MIYRGVPRACRLIGFRCWGSKFRVLGLFLGKQAGFRVLSATQVFIRHSISLRLRLYVILFTYYPRRISCMVKVPGGSISLMRCAD